MNNDPRYPYTHQGPAVHGSKLADYLISEHSLREDHPELFDNDFTDAGEKFKANLKEGEDGT